MDITYFKDHPDYQQIETIEIVEKIYDTYKVANIYPLSHMYYRHEEFPNLKENNIVILISKPKTNLKLSICKITNNSFIVLKDIMVRKYSIKAYEFLWKEKIMKVETMSNFEFAKTQYVDIFKILEYILLDFEIRNPSDDLPKTCTKESFLDFISSLCPGSYFYEEKIKEKPQEYVQNGLTSIINDMFSLFIKKEEVPFSFALAHILMICEVQSMNLCYLGIDY